MWLPTRTNTPEAALLTEQPGWANLPAVRDSAVWLLDGPAYYNPPGPPVVRGVEVLAHALHGNDFSVTSAEVAHSPG